MKNPHVHLSQDGYEATVEVETPVGIFTTTTTRKPPTPPFDVADFDMLYEHAHALATSGTIAIGESRRAYRRVLPGGTKVLYVHISTGPPTWWLPRFAAYRRPSKRDGVMETVVRFGWLRGALTFAVSRNRRA